MTPASLQPSPCVGAASPVSRCLRWSAERDAPSPPPTLPVRRLTADPADLLLVLALAVGMPLSLWTIGISHVMTTVPFATLVLMARLQGFSKEIEEASLDLGVNSFMTFWRVTFPLILPGIAASLLLTFVASFDEFLFALFLGGSDVTLPVFMWTQVRFPQTLPTVLALGALIFLVSVALVCTAAWLRRMGDKHENIST